MSRPWRATSNAPVALLAVVLALGSLMRCVGAPCTEPDLLPGASANDWVTTAGWRTYRDQQHGFAVQYPRDFAPRVPGNRLVAAGAVVTFVPTFDPSVDETGVETNLHEVSVTVGVVGAAGNPRRPPSPCLAGEGELRLPGVRLVGDIAFFRSCFSDAGAGNAYDTVSYQATRGPWSYEIVLFLHSGNLGCYPEGTVVAFDPWRFLRVLDMIVSTFQILPLDSCQSGLALS